MFKAKICGSRSVEDKKKKLDFEDQNKIWTHKYSSKKIACPRIQSLDHHAHFLDALPSHQVLTVIRGNQFNLYVSSRPQNHQKIEAEGGSNHAFVCLENKNKT